jgi:FG-GAP repeat protein/VCBS repeat protein
MELSRFGFAAFAVLWMTGLIAGAASAAQATLVPVWKVESNQNQAGLGSTVSSAGDVNGDGYGDVIVAAYGFDNVETDEGRAYVFHGSATGPEKLPAWTAEVDQAYATINAATAAGDVNGDGYGDVVVASYSYSNGEYLEGKAFLYLGSAAGLATTSAWTAEGNEQAAYFGIAVASAGDVNGDGYGDVIVGALFGDIDHTQQAEGVSFLYLGSAAGLSASPAWSAEGNQQYSGFGDGKSAGDVNGDGYGDVVVGAYSFNNGQRDEGRAYVYLGSPSGPSTSPDWMVEGDQEEAYLGSSVESAGDVDGDGFDDLIVGVPGYRSFQFGLMAEGRVHVYLGSAAGLSTSPAWTVTGNQGAASFGTVAGAGDLDGDGYDDVLIGASTFDHGERNEGRVVAFYGSPAGLATHASWLVESNQREALFGSALASAGDVNGDGFSDVLVGAYQFDAGQPNEGRAFAYLGSSRLHLR